MTIKTRTKDDGTVLVISITGKFDFQLLNEFRQSYSNHGLGIRRYVVDLKETSSIDSSVLGMLLNMQRTLKENDKAIDITGCNEEVMKVFKISNFDKKFTIS